MILHTRTDAQLRQDTAQFREVVERAVAQFMEKNGAGEYAGTWAMADLRMRFSDVTRKYIRLIPQVWERVGAFEWAKVDESLMDLLVYVVMMAVEARRLRSGYYNVVEGGDAASTGDGRQPRHRAGGGQEPADRPRDHDSEPNGVG